MMETRDVLAMSPVVAPDQRQARREARLEIIRQVALGATASEARRRCSVPMHRSTVYRLLKRVEREGEHALVERRHGHPIKLREEGETLRKSQCLYESRKGSPDERHSPKGEISSQ